MTKYFVKSTVESMKRTYLISKEWVNATDQDN